MAGIVFIGPPGSGKGTQADMLKQKFEGKKVCHLSTGDMLRAAIQAGTELGKKVKPILESGGLVEDDTMVALIGDTINEDRCHDGFILDGFPRTVVQAEKLDEMLTKDAHHRKIDAALEFSIRDEEVLARISGRWIHKSSGRSYHTLYRPPKVSGLDDVTSEPLYRRPDDSEEVIGKRLEAFHKQTTPVISYYKRTGVLTTLDAWKSAEQVFSQISQALKDKLS